MSIVLGEHNLQRSASNTAGEIGDNGSKDGACSNGGDDRQLMNKSDVYNASKGRELSGKENAVKGVHENAEEHRQRVAIGSRLTKSKIGVLKKVKIKKPRKEKGVSERRKSNRLISRMAIGDFTNDEETAIDLTADDDDVAGLRVYENVEHQTSEGDDAAMKTVTTRKRSHTNKDSGKGKQTKQREHGVGSSSRKSTRKRVDVIEYSDDGHGDASTDDREYSEEDIAVAKEGRKKSSIRAKGKGSSSVSGKGKHDAVEGGVKGTKKRKMCEREKNSAKVRTKSRKKDISEDDSDGEKILKAKFASLQIRTSPKPLLVALRSMSDEQKKAVLEMGFGSLLKFNIDELPAKLLYYVVDKFDASNMEIKIDNGTIKVSVESIHDMLGLPIGGTRLDELLVTKMDKELLDNWWAQFGGDKEVSPVDIKKQVVLSSKGDWNFKLNIIALVINILGGCKCRGKAEVNVLKYIRKDTIINNIDWCRHLWLQFKDCKKTWTAGMIQKYFTGPATLLALLYLDGTVGTSITVERVRPTIYAWNYDLMSYREAAEMIDDGFGKLDVNDEHHVECVEENREDDEVLTRPPKTVEDYINQMEALENMMCKYKNKLHETAVEAKAKFPDSEVVVDWNDKVEGMCGLDNEPVNGSNFKTPGKTNVETGGSGNLMGTEDGDGQMSQFWFSPTFQESMSKYDKEMADKQSKENNMCASVGRTDVITNQGYTSETGPSFSIGLTQAFESVRGDDVMMSKVADLIPIRTVVPPAVAGRDKRSLRLPPNCKSPFAKRVVDIGARISIAETKVWNLFNDGVGNNKEGRASVRESVQSLAQQKWVAIDVIDSWAAMLNKDEDKRNTKSPYRLFCHTGMLTDDMMTDETDVNLRLKLFMASLGEVVNKNQALMSLKNVDLVFFPILQRSHYYLICFNMKTPSCAIIDNHYDLSDVEQKYKQIPQKLQSVFVAYLKKIGHIAWGPLKNTRPTRMPIGWRTKSNWDDCGVFLMRHMECYMGEAAGKWECGLDVDSVGQKRQLMKLRK